MRNKVKGYALRVYIYKLGAQFSQSGLRLYVYKVDCAVLVTAAVELLCGRIQEGSVAEIKRAAGLI